MSCSLSYVTLTNCPLLSRAYRLDDRLKGFFASRSKTDDPPVINNNLDSSRRGLSFLDFLDLTNNLDGTLGSKIKSVDGLDTVTSEDTLGHGCTVSEENEEVGLLRSESVYPSL